tara:strand:- start:639 stop:1697 length:1059 start_codon:yes stop_codon:yes gene_type:complete
MLSLEASLFYFRFGILVLAFSYFCTFYKKTFIKYFFISISFCFLLLIFDSFFQLLFNKNIFGFFNEDGRITSFFRTERILGSYLSRLLPLLIAMYFLFYKKNNNYSELSLVLLILLTGIVVFISGERTAFFINISSVLLIFILNSHKFNLKVFFIVFLFISLFLVNLLNPNVKYRMINQTSAQINLYDYENNKFNNLSEFNLFFTAQHEVIFKSAYKIFLTNKIFGVGPKNFREYCKYSEFKTYTSQDGSVDGCNSSPHNIYFQLLAETGLIGFLIVLSIWFSLIYFLTRVFIYKFSSKPCIFKDYQICIMIIIFINISPIIPTGNFFNSYLSTVLYLPIGFLSLFNEKNFT